jgi:hypothetical protein
MSSSRAGTALRPELARSGLLNSMTGKFFRKIEGDRYGKQCKKSAYMGKEEVLERNWLIWKLVYRLIESAQGNRKYGGRV